MSRDMLDDAREPAAVVHGPARLGVGPDVAVGDGKDNGHALGAQEQVDEHVDERVGGHAHEHLEEDVHEHDDAVDEHVGARADSGSSDNRAHREKANNLRPHPAAEIFPKMAEAEFDALVTDIEQNGQLEPIIIYEGMILDGRHRYKACQQLGLKCRTIEWDGGGSPEEFVISMNVRRRHLTASQLAMIAAKVITFGHGGNRYLKQAAKMPLGITQKTAAKMFNIGERYVRLAATVVAKGAPELQEAVERGDIALPDAVKVAELSKARQIEIASGRSAKRQAKKAAARIKAADQARRRQADAQRHHEKRHNGPDKPGWAETGVSASDFEIERNEAVTLAEANALIADLRGQIGVLDQRIISALEDARIWRERALGAGWRETA